MDIAVIGASAEILAAIGVVGSLIFLAVQVRKNTQTLRSQILETHLDRVVANFARPLDAAVATVIHKAKKSFIDLNGPEMIIFNAWASEYLINANHLMIFTDEGLLDPRYAQMIDRRIQWFFKNSGMRQWWQDEDRHPMPDYIEAVFNEKIQQLWPDSAQ